MTDSIVFSSVQEVNRETEENVCFQKSFSTHHRMDPNVTTTTAVMATPTPDLDLYLLLDESGSMHPRKNSLVGGFNELIQKQRRLNPDGCRVSLFTFNEEVRQVYSLKPLSEVPLLTSDDYHPDCMTALRDAMSHVLEKIEEDFDVESGRTVLLVVMTDGEENASMAVSVTELQTALANYKGQITYMGSNQDAILNGRGMGVAAEASLTYDDENILEAIDSLGDAVGRIRSGASSTICFTDHERGRSSGSGGWGGRGGWGTNSSSSTRTQRGESEWTSMWDGTSPFPIPLAVDDSSLEIPSGMMGTPVSDV
jgi:uncharacterized protein YegL